MDEVEKFTETRLVSLIRVRAGFRFEFFRIHREEVAKRGSEPLDSHRRTVST